MANYNSSNYSPNNSGSNKEDKRSELRKMCDDGCIAAQYSNTHFVKIRPAFSIDKIQFAFVPKKGVKGEHFDVYVDTVIFDRWADDILSFRAAKRLRAEAEAVAKLDNKDRYNFQYYYTRRTGTDYDHQVQIQPSYRKNGGYAIQGSCKINGSWQNISIPVDYNWLITMAKFYTLVSDEYWHNCAKLILHGLDVRAERYKQKHQNSNANDDYADYSAFEETAPAPQPVVQSAPQPVDNGFVEESSWNEFPSLDAAGSYDISNDDLPF